MDFSSESFWKTWLEFCSTHHRRFNTSYDNIDGSSLKQICDAIATCKTTIIFVAPLNFEIEIDGKVHTLSTFNQKIGELFGGFILRGPPIWLQVGKTITEIGKRQYNAFLHISNYAPKNQSEKSKKTTTAKIYDKKYVTTLDIFESIDHFQTFISQFIKSKETTPKWFDELQYLDDEAQKNTITVNEEVIRGANEAIKAARTKVENNNRFKSILYTNGDELAEIVREMLEELMDGDLSSFVDEKKEDFRISKNGLTFLGEIKGTNSNINNSNISQLTNNCDLYEEKCKENGETAEIRRLLIMNHQRDKAPVERQPVHDKQIEKAQRDECLIIETLTLLKLYELFKNGRCRSEDFVKIFAEKTGILTIDFVEKTYVFN